MEEIQIKKGRAPKRPKRPRYKYFFHSLAVGHHLVIKRVDANVESIRACASYAGHKLSRKFSVSELDNGDVTVERTK